MNDDGKILIDCEERYFSTVIDDVTRENIQRRMRRVNNVVGREVSKLLKEERVTFLHN